MARMLAALVLVLVGVAAPAFAKNLCVADGSSTFVFTKIKKLKAGRSISLQGIYLQSGAAHPFDGSAMMLTDGITVKAGVFVHSMTNTNNFTMEWTTTAAYTGTAPYDSDGDFQFNGNLSLTTVDCSTVTIP